MSGSHAVTPIFGAASSVTTQLPGLAAAAALNESMGTQRFQGQPVPQAIFMDPSSSSQANQAPVPGDVENDAESNAAGASTQENANENVNPLGVTETDEERRAREERFQRLFNSGRLGTPTLEEGEPGRRFTLPVVRPTLK
ncbi:hypothetical protein BGW38_004810 [Lunasporangiospora selenospora]|uniref:Uncharacterized protein n=1 Tax=Lunasporangiospora selenospora TaxID=979761 RepID=A0A9P6FPC1_9FUNG|nr:hypothetical protein BGW38_004810 [Lunasporangiospora selenospora]